MLTALGHLEMLADTPGLPEVFKPLMVLLIIIVLASSLVMWIRGRMLDKDASQSGGFALSDIRAMHRRGEMTDEEFEKARDAIVGPMKAAAQKAADQRAAAGKADPSTRLKRKPADTDEVEPE